MVEFEWSQWYPLSKQSLAKIPDVPGVYEIRTDYEFGRLRGTSRVVFVGAAWRGSKPTLRKRLGQRITEPDQFLSGEEKRLRETGHALDFRFAEAKDSETARQMEVHRLLHFEEEYWEAPPGVHKRLG